MRVMNDILEVCIFCISIDIDGCRTKHPGMKHPFVPFVTTLDKTSYTDLPTWTIRIYHECEGRIEKSVPRITVWHHETCRVMTNGDPEGRIFLSFSHPNNGFFLLLTIIYHILFLRKGSQKFLNTQRCDML